MTERSRSNYGLGLALESGRKMFDSLSHAYINSKYKGDVEDILSDMELAVERLCSDAPDITDTSQRHQAIKFSYKNYRGETSIRHVVVMNVRWGHTERHPEPGVLLKGFDLDKREIREFSLKDCDFTITK